MSTTATTTTAGTTTWAIDPAHTHVAFAVKHLMISTVRGRFGGVSGTVVTDEADPTRGIAEIEIDAASIDTRESQRDAHLKSADFFDVEKFPTLLFKSKRVTDAKGDPRGDARRDLARDREGSVGRRALGLQRHDGHQAQRLRADLEPGARGRRLPGRRRHQDLSRCRAGEEVSRVFPSPELQPFPDGPASPGAIPSAPEES
jgi:hypothetical protein